jgi:hypothetical protein
MVGAAPVVPSFPATSTTLPSGSYASRGFYPDSSCAPANLLHEDAMVANQCFQSYDPTQGAFMKLMVAQDANFDQNNLMYSMTVFYNDASCTTATVAPSMYETHTVGACDYYITAPYPSAPSSGYFKMNLLPHVPVASDVAPTTGAFTS